MRKKRKQPSMPFESQGLLWLMGPRNISYRRRVSAPYFSTIMSGLTTLYIDFDIFSIAQPHTYLPSSSTNSAVAYSGRHCLKASTSSTSLCTMFTSTCIGVVSYWSFSPRLTKVLVSLMRYTKLERPCIMPWLTSFWNGSSLHDTPRSKRNLSQKRL